MEKRAQKRRQLTEKMADHLLARGLGDFTLRALGAATGTSDRMLLHYFTDKGDLLAATLTLVAERLLTNLDHLHPGKLSVQELLTFLARLLNNPAIQPYTNLWLELATVAIREGEPYRSVAAQIADGFLAWIKANLASDADPTAAAAYILTIVEGLVVLNAVGKADAAQCAVEWALQTGLLSDLKEKK